MKKEFGFTLIEVIVSLMLVGVLAAIGGTMLTEGIKGYIFSKDCAEIAQKAELAFSRLNNEITRLQDVTANSTSSSISIKNTKGNKTIGLDNGKIKINGDILIDDVNSFTLTYYHSDGTFSPTWPVTNDIGDLSAIKIELIILTQPFITYVAPRNNRRYSF
jgi:prepilin-type N-terminal cleavage/methylation domain-containing protein